MTVRPIPEGYHTLTPYLTVTGAPKVIEFLKEAFGAEFSFEPMKRPDGAIMHAELKIGDSRVMIAEESDQMKATPSSLYVYVPDVDRVYRTAITAGGKSVMERAKMRIDGYLSGCVRDPAGNSWNIATHVEDVQSAELKKRAEDFFNKQKNKAA